MKYIPHVKRMGRGNKETSKRFSLVAAKKKHNTWDFFSFFFPTLSFPVFMIFAGLIPYTPICDQDRISPYNINTISSRQVMRIKKNIN